MKSGASSPLVFSPSEPLTLGVEMEVQLLNRHTMDLQAASPMLLSLYRGDPTRVKVELFQSMLEINTGICKDAHEVRDDLSRTVWEVRNLADRLGLRMASSGTHPFANYGDRILYPAERYKELIDRNQWIARRLMIFGLHIHIGMRGGEHAIQMNNALLHHLPLLLAFSASSPFWHGEDTELASSRITFFEALPTGGHPCAIHSWEEFESIYEKLIRSGAIRSPKDIWWDIRPSPGFGTLEIRVCDGLPTVAETVAVTALVHALAAHIDEQLSSGRRFAPPPDWIMRENKWRASRHGVGASLIVDNDGTSEPLTKIAEGLFQTLAPYRERFGYDLEFGLLTRIMDNGGSHQRQRLAAKQYSGDLVKVTDFLAREFEYGSPLWPEDLVFKLAT